VKHNVIFDFIKYYFICFLYYTFRLFFRHIRVSH